MFSTDASYILPVSCLKSFRFSLSRTNALLVSTPMMLSLYVPVMRELVRRTSRALRSMRFWKRALTQPSIGMTASASSASFTFIASIATAMPSINVTPQMMSRNAHARMLASRSLSEVIRAINQPTGRWS